MRFWQQFVASIALLLGASAGAADSANPVEFNRDIRPILADHCFQCHGPDAAQRKADLRLDIEPKTDREGGPVIVAGQPDKSELWRRVTSTDLDDQMPPPGKGRRLTDAELSTLRHWITSGGQFEKHWSLLPIRRPPPPQIQTSECIIQNSIDPFIVTKLLSSGLTSSPEADRPTLLRRVSFALTGLPPSLDDLQEFAAVPPSLPLSPSPPLPLSQSTNRPADSPDWYERYIDKLLASPRYGERMAVPWLDAARYADTSGYQSDGERYMWRWRDWVIEALNANMPFDQFTIEQLAGDLLPNATLDQKIATGFNRNHRGNAEGGIIPEEYAAEYVADRVETTATVWLGLTLGCCRCHDHKYDPFTQRDFYSLFAFFNNIPEKGRAIKIGNSPPYIQAPTRLQQEEWHRLQKQCAEAEGDFFDHSGDLVLKVLTWEERRTNEALGNWQPSEHLLAHFPLDGETTEQVSGRVSKLDGKEFNSIKGVIGEAVEFHGQTALVDAEVGDFGFFDKFTLSAWIRVPENGGGTIISRMVDEAQGEGYQLAIVGGKLQLNLVKRWLDDALRLETSSPIAPLIWHHVAAIYDGSRVADGVKLFVDGKPQQLVVLLDELNQTFSTKQPFRIGGGGAPEARFRGTIDEVRAYRSALHPEDVQVLAVRESLDQILRTSIPERSPGQWIKLQRYFLERKASPRLQAAHRSRKSAAEQLQAFWDKLPTVMVMEELPTPRETHILLRGQYDKPGDRVQPNTPAELPPLSLGSSVTNNVSLPLPLEEGRGEGSQTGSAPESKPQSTLNLEPGTLNSIPNRLDLAKWLVNRDNPLTSRVIVNRAWQLHFGTGLVKTSEDFGRQGEWPSHPDLLDHLASEFQTNWDVKKLHRTIVTSATYRQSSEFKVRAPAKPVDSKFKVSADYSTLNFEPGTLNSAAADPDNRLLSRGPRLRLSAEMLRDQALFASGQLVEQLGGPSVKPPQPLGLWSELTGGDDYKPGSGPDLVRRSLYTFWKRTIPPPTLSTFDSPTREACTVRDSRTNTPLQALALLNEPTFVSVSRALADRIIREAQTPTDRITRATLHILNRPPTPQELQILSAALNRNLQHHPADEPAAYTLICTTILNLDEAITSQ